ncbi:hypothetical protein ACQJBY_009434 [Aegilops geniculata]
MEAVHPVPNPSGSSLKKKTDLPHAYARSSAESTHGFASLGTGGRPPRRPTRFAAHRRRPVAGRSSPRPLPPRRHLPSLSSLSTVLRRRLLLAGLRGGDPPPPASAPPLPAPTPRAPSAPRPSLPKCPHRRRELTPALHLPQLLSLILLYYRCSSSAGQLPRVPPLPTRAPSGPPRCVCALDPDPPLSWVQHRGELAAVVGVDGGELSAG